MSTPRHHHGHRAAQIAAVSFALTVLAYLVVTSHRRPNPGPGAAGGGQAAPAMADDDVGTWRPPPTVSAANDPASNTSGEPPGARPGQVFLSTSKSLVLDSPQLDPAFFYSSKSAVVELPGTAPADGRKAVPTPTFLYSSKSAVIGTPVPPFLPSTKSGIPGLDGGQKPRPKVAPQSNAPPPNRRSESGAAGPGGR